MSDRVGLKKPKVVVKRTSIALTDEALDLISQAKNRMKANKNLTGSVDARVSKGASKGIVTEMKKMIGEIDDLEQIEPLSSGTNIEDQQQLI